MTSTRRGVVPSPAPEPLGAVAGVLDRAAHAQATAAVVVASGTPAVVRRGALGLGCRNEASCARAEYTNSELLRAAISQARATTPEDNLLGALDLGSRTLADHRGGKLLAVIDSGLQTVAPLRFQDPGVLASDPAEVADYLASVGALPSLAGDTVVFSGIGDTVGPQPALPTAQRTNLRAIWAAIAQRAGAASVQFVHDPLTAQPAAGLPPVTTVPVGPPVSFDATTVSLPDATLGFWHDSAVLRDPTTARATLRQLADRITATRTTVLITGITANVGPLAGQRTLGQARADAVAAILKQLGVPTNRVRTVGVGSAWPGYVPDHDATGHLLPGPAARNRMVLVEFQHRATTKAAE